MSNFLLLLSDLILSNTTLSGASIIPSGSVIQFQQTGQNNLNISNGTDIGTGGMLQISNPTLSSINNWNIIPGYKGSTQTDGWVTLDMPGVGNVYIWDNLEISNNLTCDSSLTVIGNVQFNSTFNCSGIFTVNSTTLFVNPTIGNGAVGTFFNILDSGYGASTFNGSMNLNNNILFGSNNSYSIGTSNKSVSAINTCSVNTYSPTSSSSYSTKGVYTTSFTQGTSETTVFSIPFKLSPSSGDCCIVNVKGVANGSFNNGAVQYMESTTGFYYSGGSSWLPITSFSAISYAGAALLTSYTWGFNATNILIVATENSGQGGKITWSYDITYGTN